jgi:hypothetical protein
MRDYGRIYARYWTSADIQDLADQPKLLGAYLLSCAHGTIAGVFHLPDGYAAEDLRWGIDTLSEGFEKLAEIGFVQRCATTKWVWICKHLEWNKPEGPKQWIAVRKMVARVPASVSWRNSFEWHLKQYGCPIDGVSKALPDPKDTPSNAVSVSVAVSGTGSEGGTVSAAGILGGEEGNDAVAQKGSSSRERFSKNNSRSKSPSTERRNDSFERINVDVLRLITDACFEPDDPLRIAKSLHISEAQVKTSISQLRDRGQLPAEVRS